MINDNCCYLTVKGSSARCLALLIAVVKSRWCLAQLPFRLAESILFQRFKYLDKVFTSL